MLRNDATNIYIYIYYFLLSQISAYMVKTRVDTSQKGEKAPYHFPNFFLTLSKSSRKQK